MIKDIQNRILYTAVDTSQLPENLQEYKCDLFVEQNIETKQSTQYLKFKHQSEPSFKIILSASKRPAILMHVFKMQNIQKLSLKGKVSRILESQVERTIKKTQYKEAQSDQDQDVFMQKRLILHQQDNDDDDDSGSGDDSQESSKGVAPTQEGRSRARSKIIDIMNERRRPCTKDELNRILKTQYDIKIPIGMVKELTGKVCDFDRKSKGYVLKTEYVDDQRFHNKMGDPKKKVKLNGNYNNYNDDYDESEDD